MILLKTVVLFVLANPAEFYPLTEAEKKDCGICSNYLRKPISGKPVVPVYPKQYPAQLQNNNKVKCGQANSLHELKHANITETKHTKIVGGVETQRNEYPWQVGLANGYGGQITCGGSIISSKEILTAAHCVKNGTYKYPDEKFPIHKCIYAVVGEHDKSKTNEGEQWNRICDVKVHKKYIGDCEEKWFHEWWKTKDYYKNDIAVLTLCRELQFTDKVAPVCLPQPIALNNKYENKDVIASGWGRLASDDSMLPKILKKVTLKTMSNTDCFKKYKLPSSDNHESKICATNGHDNEMDTCQGDSGGPLVFSETDKNSNKYFTLIGVTSYGKGCAKKGYPGVYARVTDAMKWINEIEYEKGEKGIRGETGKHPDDDTEGSLLCLSSSSSSSSSLSSILRKNTKHLRSLKNTGGTIYYHFEKDKKLSRMNAEKTCISKYGGQLTSINTQDEYEWIKEQVKDLKMFGPIAIGGQWKDKSSRKFEWTDESEMDMSVLNANWFRTRNYQFPSYKNKKRINLELWYSRRAMGFANALDHKAPTMYICKVAPSCSA